MNKSDIAVMLSFASTLDGRVPFDEAAVEAWAVVLDPDMEGKWAADFVKKHYGRGDDLLIPSTLNRGWVEAKRARAQAKFSGDAEASDRHCRRTACQCTHTSPCYRGWIDREDNSATVPCPVCRRSLADVLLSVAPLGLRDEHDHAAIRNRYRDE